jgi:GH43 family beta-xylosidase
LGSATRYPVWKIPACPAPNCADVWAPEIHQIAGHFYINGQVGLVTEDTKANYRNLTITNTS